MNLAARRTSIINKFRYGINFYAIIGALGGKATNGGRFKEPGFAREMAFKSWENRKR
jgi:hypothetical protein